MQMSYPENHRYHINLHTQLLHHNKMNINLRRIIVM